MRDQFVLSAVCWLAVGPSIVAASPVPEPQGLGSRLKNMFTGKHPVDVPAIKITAPVAGGSKLAKTGAAAGEIAMPGGVRPVDPAAPINVGGIKVEKRPKTAFELVDDAELQATLKSINEREGWRVITGGLMPPKSPRGRAAYDRAGLTASELAKVEDAMARWGNWYRVGNAQNAAAGPSKLGAGAAPDVSPKTGPSTSSGSGRPATVMELIEDQPLREKLYEINRNHNWRGVVGGLKRPSSPDAADVYKFEKLTAEQLTKVEQAMDQWANWYKTGPGGSRFRVGAAALPATGQLGAGAPPF